jgi:RHS repeat-associated protein
MTLTRIVALVLALTSQAAFALMEGGPGAKEGDSGAGVPGVALSAEAAVGSGAATTNIVIEAPQGRGGMQPNLVLGYSSQGGGFSPYGVGWSMPIGMIQRSTRRGVPHYDGSDTFVLALPDGVVELVALGNGSYAAQIDEGHVLATPDTSAAGNAWTVHDTSGRTYTFGCDAGTTCDGRVGRGPYLTPSAGIVASLRSVQPTDFNSTFAWHLRRIVDANGNRVEYTYTQATGRAAPEDLSGIPYISQIVYGSNANVSTSTLPNMFSVSFAWADRPAGTERTAYNKGFRELLSKELQKITVSYRGTTVRSYTFTMATSQATALRLLVRVSRAGLNDTPLTLTDGTSADTVFSYNDAQVSTVEAPNAANPGFDSSPTLLGHTFADGKIRETGSVTDIATLDLDGDGRADQIKATSNSSWQVWLNPGPGLPFGGAVGWPTTFAHITNGPNPSCDSSCNCSFPDKITAALHDIDGDGLPDRVSSGGGGPWSVYYNTGNPASGFMSTADAANWTPTNAPEVSAGQTTTTDDLPDDPTTYRIDPGTYGDLIDVDGDGRSDYINCNPWTGASPYCRVNFNFGRGNGFGPPVWVRFFGKWLRLGGSASTTNDPTTGSTLHDIQVDVFDINGDGIPDKVRARGHVDSQGNIVPDAAQRGCSGFRFEVWLGTGNGWAGRDADGNPYCWPSPPVHRLRKWDDGGNAKWDLVDVTGDGLPDLVDARGYPGTNRVWKVYRNTGQGFVYMGQMFAPTQLRHHAPLDPPGTDCHQATGTTIVDQDLVDLDGDGWLDAVNGTGQVWYGHPARVRPDSLAQVQNPTGDRYAFTYAVSSDFNTANVDPALQDGRLHLPFPVWVVSTVTHTDGQTSLATNYTFDGGYYDTLLRDYRGFYKTTRTDPEGIQHLTYVQQSDVLKGKPSFQATYAPDGINVLSTTASVWTCRDGACPVHLAAGQRKIPELRQTTHVDFSSSSPTTWSTNVSAARVKSSRFNYDACGNMLQDVTNDVSAAYNVTSTPNPPPCPLNPDGTCSSYDAQARVSQAEYSGTDACGATVNRCNATTATCDTSVCNHATRLVDVGGLAKKLCYDARGNPITTRLEGLGDPEVNVTYDPSTGNPLTSKTPKGTLTTHTYDADQLYYATTTLSATDGGKTKTTLTTTTSFDPMFAQLASSQDPNGAITRNVYDAFGRLCKVYLPGDPSASSLTCAAPNLTTDAPTKYVVYKLSATGSQTDTSAKVSRTRYLPASRFLDAMGRSIQVQTVREVDGAEMLVISEARSYNAMGQLQKQGGPLAQTVPPDPTAFQPNVFANAALPVTTFQYDVFGRSTRTTNPDDTQVSTSYQFAWVTRGCDANSNASGGVAGQCDENEQDFAGRPLEHRVYLGAAASVYSRERRDYYRDARQVKVTQNQNSATIVTTTFDVLGRKASVDDPDMGAGGQVGTWTYTYDTAGNVVAQDDPITGQHLEFAYDGLGRLLSRTQVTNDTATPTSITVATYTYDCQECGGFAAYGKGRLCSVTESDPVTGLAAGGTDALRYDARGHVTNEHKTIIFKNPVTGQTTTQQFTAVTSYDAQTGLLLSTTFPTGSGTERVYSVYSSTGELQKIQSDGGEYLSNLTHDLLGRAREVVTPTTSSTVYVHDRYDYRTGIAQPSFGLEYVQTWRGTYTSPPPTDEADPTKLRKVHYLKYDADRNVMLIRDEHFTTWDPPVATSAIFYDKASRVRKSYQCAKGARGSYTGNFATDPLANLTTKDEYRSGATALTRTLGAKPHQFASIQAADPTSGTVTTNTVTYDADGNITRLSGDRSATFDVEGHLLKITLTSSGATKMVYRYDSTGRRVVAYDAGKNETTFFFGGFDVHPDAGTIVRHFSAGNRLIASSTVSGALAAAGRATGADRVLVARLGVSGAGAVGLLLLGCAAFLPGRTRRRAFGRLERRVAAVLVPVFWLAQLPLPSVAEAAQNGPPPAGSIFYHLDHLGTPRILTDETGGVVEYLATDPYGLPYAVFGSDHITRTTSKSDFQYTGHRALDGAGLVYMGARFYDPILGQFLSHDPAREFFSPYSYVGSNPFNRTDPTGADALDDFIDALRIIGMIVAPAIYSAISTGVAASESGKSIGDSVGLALKGLAISIAIFIVVAVAYYICPVLGVAVSVLLAGYMIYQGVETIRSARSTVDYAAGAIAIAGAVAALAGIAYSVGHAWAGQGQEDGANGGGQMLGGCGGGLASCGQEQTDQSLSGTTTQTSTSGQPASVNTSTSTSTEDTGPDIPPDNSGAAQAFVKGAPAPPPATTTPVSSPLPGAELRSLDGPYIHDHYWDKGGGYLRDLEQNGPFGLGKGPYTNPPWLSFAKGLATMEYRVENPPYMRSIEFPPAGPGVP